MRTPESYGDTFPPDSARFVTSSNAVRRCHKAGYAVSKGDGQVVV